MNPPVPLSSLRSKIGTIREWGPDFSGFSLRSGWDSVEAFGRRICGLMALALACAAVNPVWLPSQTTPLQYEMKADLSSANKRLDALEAKIDNLPLNVAILKENDRRQDETLESFSNRVWALIAGFVAWAGRQMFLEFGGKERGRKA